MRQVERRLRGEPHVDKHRKRQVVALRRGAEPGLEQPRHGGAVERLGRAHARRRPQQRQRRGGRGGGRQLHGERAGEAAVPARESGRENQAERQRQRRHEDDDGDDRGEEGALALERQVEAARAHAVAPAARSSRRVTSSPSSRWSR